MKLKFYHYYFKSTEDARSPRHCQSILPWLNAYLSFTNNDWKSAIKSADDEHILLMRSPVAKVFMLVVTRKQDIIKAVNTNEMSCEKLEDLLGKDKTAGFAAYLIVDDNILGLASTLRGPKITILNVFIQEIMNRLQAKTWKFNLQSIGTSITANEAMAMAQVASTKIRVTDTNVVFRAILKVLGRQADENIRSIEITINSKTKHSIGSLVKVLSEKDNHDGIDKFHIRARHTVDETLADYYIDGEGKFSEDITPAREDEMARQISKRFSEKLDDALERLDSMIRDGGRLYDQDTKRALGNIDRLDHWYAIAGHPDRPVA